MISGNILPIEPDNESQSDGEHHYLGIVRLFPAGACHPAKVPDDKTREIQFTRSMNFGSLRWTCA